MKRALAIGIAICAFFLVTSTSMQDAVLQFLAAGAIPGTPYTISPQVMLVVTLMGLVLTVIAAGRQTRSIKLPPIQQAAHVKKASRWKQLRFTLIHNWRNTLRPQLKLLQQKTVAFGRGSRRVALEFPGKLRKIVL